MMNSTIPPAIACKHLADHPICHRGFVALVFSGSRDILGELPGEPTAGIDRKYALVDPRLPDDEDFARSPGMPLPIWPADQIRPVAGVCFIFTDGGHPAVAQLEAQGAVRDEHFLLISDYPAWEVDEDLEQRLAEMLDHCGDEQGIMILGYGDQGARIADLLRQKFDVEVSRICIWDDQSVSRDRAREDGLSVFETVDELLKEVNSCGVAIYSPLAYHDRLHQLFCHLQAQELICVNNQTTHAANSYFYNHDRIMLDESAERILCVDDLTLSWRDRHLPFALGISSVRQTLRKFSQTSVRELSSDFYQQLTPDCDAAIDLSEPAPADVLHPSTFVETQRVFVSVHNHPVFPVFAARDFAGEIWPIATQSVFPSTRVGECGGVGGDVCVGGDFERILARHVYRCEIAQASQTSTQQVLLGIAAAHYAAHDPIIEIGSALGGSALLMAAATPAGKPLYSIDPGTATRDVMQFLFQREGWSDRLQQIVKTSDEAVTKLSHLRCQVGLVFIDGQHTESAAQRDIENYGPLLKPGGALLIHDVTPKHYTVMRVVIEHLLTDARYTWKCLVDGLAIFERNSV